MSFDLGKKNYFTLTSGQKQRLVSADNLHAGWLDFVDEQKNAWNDAVHRAMRTEMDAVFSNHFSTIALDTGALRAAFFDAMTISQITDREITFRFEFDRFVSSTPYARYHVVQITGIDEYAEPTTEGTKPIDFNIIFHGFSDKVNDRMIRILIAGGWEARVIMRRIRVQIG